MQMQVDVVACVLEALKADEETRVETPTLVPTDPTGRPVASLIPKKAKPRALPRLTLSEVRTRG
jgi:hypothetical protein